MSEPSLVKKTSAHRLSFNKWNILHFSLKIWLIVKNIKKKKEKRLKKISSIATDFNWRCRQRRCRRRWCWNAADPWQNFSKNIRQVSWQCSFTVCFNKRDLEWEIFNWLAYSEKISEANLLINHWLQIFPLLLAIENHLFLIYCGRSLIFRDVNPWPFRNG